MRLSPRAIVAAARRSTGPKAMSEAEADAMRYAMGALHTPQARAAASLRQAEFRAFSQFGEDGIIQWLIERVPVETEVFVELGVGNYRESNTRFLLEHNNWRGLIIDSNNAHLGYVERSGLRWRHSIDARVAFITRENVNSLVQDVSGDIGLLSVDLDGNDYWIIEAIQAIQPRIVVAEYNSVFGPERAVTVPYDPAFSRPRAHWSWLYFGASLLALEQLMQARGYRLVGSNSHGSNAFWVRNDVAGDIDETTSAAEWVASRFRDSRDRSGRLTYVDSHADRVALMSHLPLIDVITAERIRVADVRG